METKNVMLEGEIRDHEVFQGLRAFLSKGRGGRCRKAYTSPVEVFVQMRSAVSQTRALVIFTKWFQNSKNLNLNSRLNLKVHSKWNLRS